MTAHVVDEPAVFRRANDRRCLGLYERGERDSVNHGWAGTVGV